VRKTEEYEAEVEEELTATEVVGSGTTS
jgi:hypothetical protein